jgi:hypothetical protein
MLTSKKMEPIASIQHEELVFLLVRVVVLFERESEEYDEMIPVKTNSYLSLMNRYYIEA